MHTSKLIKLFKGLSRSELLEFGRYIKTPFFNRDDNLVKLYDYIKKYSPEYDSAKLEKGYFLKKVSKNQQVRDRQIHDWMSDLTKKLEDYLIYAELREQPLTRDFVLLDAMKDRKMDELFFRSIKNIGIKLNNSDKRDMFYYFYHWRLKHDAYFHSGTSKKYQSVKSIEEPMLDIDKFFCAVKLRYSAEMMTRELQYSVDHAIAMLPEVLKEIQKPIYRRNVLFKIYELVIELFYDEKDETYDKLEKLIYESPNISNDDEKSGLLLLLFNHANKRLTEGRARYRQKIFDWYVYMTDNNLLLEDGYIQVIHFINAMYVATALHEAEWLGRFINNYTQFLHHDVRKNTASLAEAYLYFTEKNYKKCLQTLIQIGGSDLVYPLNVRTLTIQCYYELGDIELIILECNNFNQYLNRNDNMAIHLKKPVKNFIKFMRLLVEVPYKKEITREKLEEKLYQHKGMRAKSWLEEKIKEVK